MVAGREKGDKPSDPAKPALVPMPWGLMLSPGNHSLMEQVRKHFIANTQRSLTDDELAMLIAEHVLSGGPIRSDEDGEARDGRAPFQIALTVCESCKSANVVGGGEPRPASAVMLAMAGCDAQHVGRVDTNQPARASQTIPPRIRRTVLLRHAHRCGVPGCRNHAFNHLHHTDPRAEGGDHNPDLLIPLCSAHHGAVHDGRLVIRGSASKGFIFEHADGSSYGSPSASGEASALLEQVFGALLVMGWKHKQAQSIVDSIRPEVGPGVSRDEALRMALAAAPVSGVREECAEYVASVPCVRAPPGGLDRPPAREACAEPGATSDPCASARVRIARECRPNTQASTSCEPRRRSSKRAVMLGPTRFERCRRPSRPTHVRAEHEPLAGALDHLRPQSRHAEQMT